MAYKKSELIRKIRESGKPLYQRPCVNYTGVTTDTKERYTEVIAEHLLANLDEFRNGFETVTRQKSYKVKGHSVEPYTFDPTDTTVRRKEERLARSLRGHRYSNCRLQILDYQIPLKDARAVTNKENEGLGKIDLLGSVSDGLVVIEFKRPDSPETLLRCILEAYSYWATVDREKLAKDFNREGESVYAGVLIYEDSQPSKDFWARPSKVWDLMVALGVRAYVLSEVYFDGTVTSWDVTGGCY
jgi:hypothetical protein